ncbi:beta-propeller fold lactonase family protein [Sorangium sp. So ce1128]
MRSRSSRLHALTLALVGALLFSWAIGGAARAEPDFTVFETGQVRPLALSPDGKRLFAVNTPDNRLEIFDVERRGLRHRGSVHVGLEPIAVAARSRTEVWVVNHLSDSVSVVDVSSPASARVTRTLLVGDEPRDIVFAGPRRDRAFITTAHRGQNSPADPQLTTPGVGRADVWVFDARALGASLGGDPLTLLTLFCDTPRALAVSPDGSRVYAAAFHSGNRTTALQEGLVPDGGEPLGLPGPRVDAAGEPQPEAGLIVKFDGAHWVDGIGRTWDSAVRFSLPDKDVFTIDAAASPPAVLGAHAGVGTVLFNMAVNPVSGRVYVANTDANNLTRFEGPPTTGGSVQGHTAESHITILDEHEIRIRHLNKHIDFSACCAPIPNDENEKSLSQPMGMAVSSDGRTMYVAAFGSSKVGVFDTAELESDSFVPDTSQQIRVTGGGPSGLVLDEARGLLYVLTRFDNSISVIDAARREEIAHLAMVSPEPESVTAGRRFLYDASFTSSHGDTACSSCHMFGDFDSLAWDLGDPNGETIPNHGPFAFGPCIPDLSAPPGAPPTCFDPSFRALKGPMTTQSLRGLANHGSMHWRGDRTGGNDEPSVQPDSGAFNEELAFKKFNAAFVGLIGRHAELDEADMQAFTDFVLQITYPPNPIRNLDNTLTPEQAAGEAHFFGEVSDSVINCVGCHVLDPSANSEFGVDRPGFFGTDGRWSFEAEPQFFKVPHLRNMYQKVGMFGMAPVPFLLPGFGVLGDESNEHMGDQVRGTGFFHDGSFDTLHRFHGATVFVRREAGEAGPGDPGNPGGFPFAPPVDPASAAVFAEGIEMRRNMEQFMLAFDSNLAPIVGQQVTLTSCNAAVAGPRIDLLRARADAGECDLVAKRRRGAREAGALYLGGGMFATDRRDDAPVSDAALRRLARTWAGEITYTCVPPGSGERIGLDRDRDGHRDGDELDAGSRPDDFWSTP